jgi:hypothetical protein
MLGVITSSSFFVPQVNLPGSMASFVPPAIPIQTIAANGGKTTQQLLRLIRLPRGVRGLGQDPGAPAFSLPDVYVPPPGTPLPWWVTDILVPWEHNPFLKKSKAEILAAIGDNVPAGVPASVPTVPVPAGARVPASAPTVPPVPAPPTVPAPTATATGGISFLPILLLGGLVLVLFVARK